MKHGTLAKAGLPATADRVSPAGVSRPSADTFIGAGVSLCRAVPRSQSCGAQPGAQKGAVLFFTLIALVAMTLAALAMVRSVDTSNLVAGNIALKQSAIQEADRVMNTAFTCLDSGGALLALSLNSDHVGTCHYYSFLQPDVNKPFGIPEVLELGSAIDSTNATTNNTSSYVIERMCRITGAWDAVGQSCVESPFGKAAAHGDIRTTQAQIQPQALYRISVRISGPRNVTAYSQMVMNAGT